MADETKIIRIVIDSSRAVDGSAAATRAMEKMERGVMATAAAMTRLEQGLGRVGGLLKAQLALMVADTGARLLQLGKSALDAAANMDELAEQLGITTTGLQALQFSAVQNGVKLEQLETGISKFSQKMGEAANGSKEMVEALGALGVKNLDVQGKLRPTEVLLSEVAAAITKIEDPAKRSAAAVEFFGKTGTRMLPMLSELAKGQDALAASAERAGAMIGGHTVQRLDQFGDAAARTGLKLRAVFADAAVAVLDWAERNIAAIESIPIIGSVVAVLRNLDQVKDGLGNMLESVGDFTDTGRAGFDQLYIAGARFAAGFGEAIRSIPEQLGKAFVDGMNLAIEALESGLRKITGTLERNAPWLGIAETSVSLGRLAGGGASLADRNAAIHAAEDRAEADMRARGLGRDYRAERLAARAADAASAFYGSEGGPSTTGASISAIKGGGQGEADKIAKLVRDTGRDLEAANAYAEASERGARAVADLEIHFKALKAAQDAYGATAEKNAGQVTALTSKIEEQMKAAERLKNLSAFNLGTEELERSNELLAAENALINASTEQRAREIALIRLKQEVQAKGLDDNNAAEKAAIERRGEAITQNERLKAQGEELKKANELWTEPLKSALQSIQSTAANMWEQILENGKFSMAEFQQLFIRTARRAAAELLALATIRPVIGMGVQMLGSAGLVSQQTAANLGYGGGGGVGGISMPNFGGGMGGFELPEWLGGGTFGNLMAATPFASAAPAGGFASISELLASGAAGSSAALANGGGVGGMLAGTSVGSMLGAGLGIGMGAYNLATSKNTAQTIGGIGQMIGGGMMLIPGMQIPGMVVSALSAILPSLLGGEEYQWAPLAGANVRFDPGAGGYSSTATQQLGGKSISGQYAGVGQTLDAFFKAAGGITDPSRAFSAAVWNNQREGTTSTYQISPTQGSNQMSEGSGDQSAAVDRMIAKVFYNSIQNNAAMNAQPTLRTAFSNREPTTTAQIAGLFDLIKAYDALGKETSSAETALKSISDSFATLTAGANEWGLALAPIEAAQKKQSIRTAQDFIDSMLDPMAVQMRALDDQRRDSLASAEYIRDNVADVYVDMARIAEYWTKKKADLEAQYYQGSAENLQNLIKRLTYGDLANAAPALSLAGTRGTYEAALAQSRAGSASAFANLAGSAETYVGQARSYFASSAEYAALVEEIRRALEEQVAAHTGGASSAAGTAAANDASNAVLQSNAELRSMVATLVGELSGVKDQLAAATAQMQRRA